MTPFLGIVLCGILAALALWAITHQEFFMSTRITSTEHKAALYDSTTNTAFGPVFDSEDDGESFLRWYEADHLLDLRQLDDEALTKAVNDWRALRRCPETRIHSLRDWQCEMDRGHAGEHLHYMPSGLRYTWPNHDAPRALRSVAT